MAIIKLDDRIKKILKPSKTAIIVMDMMDGYCNPDSVLAKYFKKYYGTDLQDLDKVAVRIKSFLDLSRHYPIAATVFVRMVEQSKLMPENIKLKMEIENAPDVAEINGRGWNYYKVKPQTGDHEIIKYSYDAFFNTELNEYLKERQIETVIIVGGYASVCVDTTARTAAQLGYHTFVPADLTADPGLPHNLQTPEVIRQKLETINTVMGYMPLSSEIIEAWEQGV